MSTTTTHLNEVIVDQILYIKELETIVEELREQNEVLYEAKIEADMRMIDENRRENNMIDYEDISETQPADQSDKDRSDDLLYCIKSLEGEFEFCGWRPMHNRLYNSFIEEYNRLNKGD